MIDEKISFEDFFVNILVFLGCGRSIGRPRRRGEKLRLTAWQQYKRRQRIQRRRELRAKEKP